MKTEKKLGLGSGISICVGLIVATSCLVSLGTGIGSVGRWFIIPLFCVMILNWFVAISFSELNSIMPDVDGGTGQYLLTGVGPVFSIIGNVGTYVIAMIFAMTSELSICGMVFQDLFFPNMDARILSLIILAVFFVINLRGVDLFAKVQNILVILLIGSMGLFGIIGCFRLGIADNIKLYEAWAEEYPYPTYNQIYIPGCLWMDLVHDGKLSKDKIINLGAILAGKAPGRTSDDEVIIYSIGGMPVEDVAWGKKCYEKAKELGIGTKLNLWEKPYLF